MTLTNDLKQSIYMAAVSGKLTETLDTDTPIEDYIQQLKDEKEVAGGARKARKGQNIDEITDTEIPCDIPATWRYVRIIDAVKSISAGGDKPSNFSKEKTEQYSVPVISNGETNMGIFGYTDIPSVSELALTVSGRGTIGYSVIRNEPFVPIVRLLVILPLKGTNLQYIQLTLSALIEFGSGTAVKQLTVPMISPKVIPLPPPEEQQRIVDRVNELLAKVDEFEKIENRLTAVKEKFPSDLRAAILQAAMQGQLTEQLDTDGSVDTLYNSLINERQSLIAKKVIKNEKLQEIADYPFDIPYGWRFIRLGCVINLLSGQDFTPDKYSDVKIADGVPYLTGASNIENGDVLINRWTSTPRAIAHKGDLLLTCKGTIGAMAFLPVESAHIARQIMAISVLEGMSIYYIKYCLDFYVSEIKSKAKSQIPGIDRKTILNLVIPLPPTEEQQRIVERLDALLPLCDELTEE